MKKSLLLVLFTSLSSTLALKAEGPKEIYMATWSTMAELGTPVTPNSSDPVLSYNSETGSYEGEIIDWPRLAVNPYIVKIPYSVENGNITYYGVEGSTQAFVFNTKESESFEFTASSDPSLFKGFGLSMVNNQGVVDVKISMNLDTSTITFTKFESGEGQEIPVFLGVFPENGGSLDLGEDGGVVIQLSFNGEVTSLEALSDGTLLEAESEGTGEIWNIYIPAEKIEEIAQSAQGILSLSIQKAYAGNLPVSFENGSPVLNLSYTITGITHEAVLLFEGDESGLETLGFYKYPEYFIGDEIDIEGNVYPLTYTTGVTYLFTVGSEYEVTISSDIESQEGENWKLGEGYTTKRGPNGEPTGEKGSDGTTLTIYGGSNGATFKISVNPKEDAGVNSIEVEPEYKVYGIDGGLVLKSGKKSDIGSLPAGIYVINGKKVLIK